MKDLHHARDTVLPDGTTVHIRSASGADKDRLLSMWERLSPATIHGRFFGLVGMNEERAHAMLVPGPGGGIVLAATLGEHLVGLGRCDRLVDEPDTAEFAVLVEDEHQGRGIGMALVRDLAEAARAAGLGRFTGDVLGGNMRMVNLITGLGLEFTSQSEGGLLHTEFSLQPTDEYLAAVAADEKEAATAALGRFFRPRRVAVVGASRDRTAIGGLVFANLVAGDFPGPVYPVNPSAESVQSVAAYPALSDCPQVPDLVVVCVPAPLVPDIVDEAGKLGVRAVCVISAGFSEVSGGGPDLQEDLMRRAQAHGLRIVGPNCMGLLNAAADHRLNATFSQLFPRPGRVGFLSQSGALGLSALKQLEEHRIGVSTFISVGNKADVSGNDLLLYWEDDPDTDVILLYLESFGNPRRFARIARRIARRKPIVAVKGGRTGAGQRAVSSHTAAMAAGDVAVDALFRQSGVIRTDTLAEMLDVAAVLGSQPPPPGPRVAIVTNGGGPGALAADACEDRGLEVPQLSEETVTLLRSFLAAEAAIGNPVDMIASSTAQQYGQTVRALADSSDVDAVLAIFIPPVMTRAEDVASALASARAEMPPDKTLVAVFMDTGQAPDALAEAGIPFFTAPEPAATALGRAAEWGAWRRRPQGSIVLPEGTAPDRARALVDRALDGRDSVWASAETTREILGSYGIPLARAAQVQTPEEAAEAQRDIGAPVAVKLAAPIHKADVGGLTLDVTSPEQAADAVTSMRQRLVDAGLGEHAEAFLVQEMVTDGVEMAAGVTSDPSFGPLVMAGLGGTLVELLGDVAVRVTPLTDLDVHEMLTSLKAYRLLRGYRGSPARDIAAFSELLLRLGALVEDVPEIAELDLNPVFVRTEGAVAVDARIRLHAA